MKQKTFMKPRMFLALGMLFTLLVHCAETPGVVSSEGAFNISSTSPLGTPGSSSKKSCSLSKTKRGLRIAGATLLGVGAASLIAGGVLWSLHEQPKEGWCSYEGNLQPYCIWNTHTGAGVAMGLGGAGLIAGGFMLGFSFAPDKSSDACK